MKKILTLAIALVMVFAIAAPAFAAGWDNPVTPDEFENLELDITALSVEESSLVWNGGTYNKLDKTYPVVAGMKVHAYAEVEIPKEKDLSEDIFNRITKGQAVLTIGVSNLKDVELVCRLEGKPVYTDRTTVDAWDECAFEIYDDACGKTVTVEIWGTTVKSDKDVKVTATLGVYNQWDDPKNPTTFTFFGKDGKEYTILKNYDGVAGSYTVYRSDKSSNGVRFYTNSNGQLVNGRVVLGGIVYQIVDSFGEMNFVKEGTTGIITGDEYRDVKAVLDNILTQMGFEYSGRAYITDKLITKNLGTIVEGSDSLTYPNGYVQELETDDPSVNPPQTGDNASVVGFVMIAIALVAAAAVTVQKVRA